MTLKNNPISWNETACIKYPSCRNWLKCQASTTNWCQHNECVCLWCAKMMHLRAKSITSFWIEITKADTFLWCCYISPRSLSLPLSQSVSPFSNALRFYSSFFLSFAHGLLQRNIIESHRIKWTWKREPSNTQYKSTRS